MIPGDGCNHVWPDNGIDAGGRGPSILVHTPDGGRLFTCRPALHQYDDEIDKTLERFDRIFKAVVKWFLVFLAGVVAGYAWAVVAYGVLG